MTRLRRLKVTSDGEHHRILDAETGEALGHLVSDLTIRLKAGEPALIHMGLVPESLEVEADAVTEPRSATEVSSRRPFRGSRGFRGPGPAVQLRIRDWPAVKEAIGRGVQAGYQCRDGVYELVTATGIACDLPSSEAEPALLAHYDPDHVREFEAQFKDTLVTRIPRPRNPRSNPRKPC